jgi:alkanesulfonate monooxygenase SsuD/methylene tetrahydromethanopterin reductase-like flavin-dependent oxidoreductase (luciferase family)
VKYGLSLPPFGPYSEPRYLAEIARQAEAVGWDGFFIWDHVVYLDPVHPLPDIWVALAAIAMTTERVRLGPMITSLARRRPWKVARETVSVDRLSNGRLILGVGLGEPANRDFGAFGEEQDNKIRAAKLDEALAILDGLWSGENFSYEGAHYRVKEVAFLPKPVQSPRIPVWVGGRWDAPAPRRRAARWDGYFPSKWRSMVSADEWAAIKAQIAQHRTSQAPFDLVQGGTTPGNDPAKAGEITAACAEFGATWWIEHIDPWRFGLGWDDLITSDVEQQMNERIQQGPPRNQ